MEASRPITDPAPRREDSDAYREHERSVLAMLASRYEELDPDGRRELYHEAWASVLARRQQGTSIGSLRSYLLGAADKAASKRVYGADARRRTTFDPRSAKLRSVPDPSGPPDEEVVAADEARRLRLLIQELDHREAAVLKLRIDEGLEPAEIRERLGLSERQYRRQAERAAQALTDEFAAFDRGEWARRKRSLLCACVMGIASERQQRKAAELIAEDPLCRAMMSELRRVAGHVAAVLPMPVAAAGSEQLDPGGWASRAADSAFVLREKLAALGDHPARGQGRPLRQRAAEALADTKQHAVSTYVRVADPTPLAGARPGAAAAMLAGCLAASGGAYCVVQGVPQGVRAPFLAEDPPRDARLHEPARARARSQSAPDTATPAPQSPAAAPLPAPAPSPSQAPPSSPASAPTQTAPAKQIPPPTPQEFEPSSSSSTASESTGAATGGGQGTPSTSRKPAAKPAPASGGSGEFAP